jgi:predicted methyltransferase
MLHQQSKGFSEMTRSTHRQAPAVGLLAVLSVIAAWGMAPATAQDTPDYAAIVATPDRSDADRQTYQRRAPVQMLTFTGARPGMKVLDMEAGAGYTSELLARAVAPGGVVYAQDSAAVMERIKDKFDIQKPSQKPS